MPGSTPQRQSQRIPQQSGEFSTARSGEITSATDSKPALLFKLASVSLAKPEGNVREVCSPQRTSSGPLFVKEVVSASAPGSEWIYRLHGFRRDACAWPYSAG